MLYFLSPKRPPPEEMSAQDARRFKRTLPIKVRHWPFRVPSEAVSREDGHEGARQERDSGDAYVFVT